MYYTSTFFGLDFSDSRLCQRENKRGINLPVERHLKRVLIDCVGLKLFLILFECINAERVDGDVILGNR